MPESSLADAFEAACAWRTFLRRFDLELGEQLVRIHGDRLSELMWRQATVRRTQASAVNHAAAVTSPEPLDTDMQEAL